MASSSSENNMLNDSRLNADAPCFVSRYHKRRDLSFNNNENSGPTTTETNRGTGFDDRKFNRNYSNNNSYAPNRGRPQRLLNNGGRPQHDSTDNNYESFSRENHGTNLRRADNLPRPPANQSATHNTSKRYSQIRQSNYSTSSNQQQQQQGNVGNNNSNDTNSDQTDQPRHQEKPRRNNWGQLNSNANNRNSKWQFRDHERNDRREYYQTTRNRIHERSEETHSTNENGNFASDDGATNFSRQNREEQSWRCSNNGGKNRGNFWSNRSHQNRNDRNRNGGRRDAEDRANNDAAAAGSEDVRDYNLARVKAEDSHRRHGSDEAGDINYNKKDDDDDVDNRKSYKSNKKVAYKTAYHRRCENEDISSEGQRGLLEEQLRDGSYECTVCCSNVGKNAAIWNCNKCYNIFHLSCIKKWASSSAVDSQSGEVPADSTSLEGEPKFWRCPTCQNSTSQVLNQYFCFCGQVTNPSYSPYHPHSCVELCAKKKGADCKHPCNILCHPGPCPPCTTYVKVKCYCGKVESSVKCNTSCNFRCQEVCNKNLNCGVHNCTHVCHKGPCEPCPIEMEQTCYCGQHNRKVLCGTKESFTSSYSCGKICNKLLDCKNHSCEKICHNGECSMCLLKPELVTHCACGKTKLEILLQQKESETKSIVANESESKKLKKKKKKNLNSNTVDKVDDNDGNVDDIVEVRNSCLDPLSRCGQVCNKELTCGSEDARHCCKRKCHNGPCGSCDETSRVLCMCKSEILLLPCKELAEKKVQSRPVKCNRQCNKKLSCGRHKCNQKCCTDAEHLCRLVCGRNLTCGLHRCEEPCHGGNCPRCWMVSFDELTCTCGSEVIYPPVACGTKPPVCHQVCTKQHMCSHEIKHCCHSEKECPPCTVLTEKRCMCGKDVRKNIPCHIKDIPCGRPCDKTLPCLVHKCRRLCHKVPCLDESHPKCTQPCPASRPGCGHPCQAPCHVGRPCPPIQCKAEVVVNCECGRRTEKIICLRERELGCKVDYSKVAAQMVASRLWNSQSIDLAVLKEIKTKDRIPCNSDCSIHKRNQRLAEALKINNPDLSNETEGRAPTNYSDFLKEFAKKDALFVSKVEHELSQLVKATQDLTIAKPKHHYFKVMKQDRRRIVHELAELYGCETESQDEEPHRSVVVTAVKNQCWLPAVPLVATSKDNAASNSSNSFHERATENRFCCNPVRFTVMKHVPPLPPMSRVVPNMQLVAKSKKGPVTDYFDFEG